MIFYCTLAEAKAELNANQAIHDDELLRLINTVSRRIDLIISGRSTRPFFGPYIEARKFLIDSRHVNSASGTFLLRGAPPLLAFTAVTSDGTAVTSTVEGYPQGVPYYNELRLTSAASGCSWWSYLDGCDPAYVEVTGTWGFHSDYANAWLSVDALTADISVSATKITVANVDGDDVWGFSDRISAGSLLKIGSEFLFVKSVNSDENSASVRRGVLGSTAAIQASGSTVYVWQTEEPIRRITARQAAAMYARKGAFQASQFDGVSTVTYPQDLLAELVNVLQEYVNLV